MLVRDLPASGWLDSTSVVGVFSDNCPTDLGAINDILIPGLQATGASVVVGQHDCNAQSALQQTPSIATRFRTAGVDHVVAVANGVSIQIFLETANSLGGWQPEYAISDWWGALSDSTAANFNATQFDGAIGFTSTRTPLINAGYPPHAGTERCQEAAAEAGLAAAWCFGHRLPPRDVRPVLPDARRDRGGRTEPDPTGVGCGDPGARASTVGELRAFLLRAREDERSGHRVHGALAPGLRVLESRLRLPGGPSMTPGRS